MASRPWTSWSSGTLAPLVGDVFESCSLEVAGVAALRTLYRAERGGSHSQGRGMRIWPSRSISARTRGTGARLTSSARGPVLAEGTSVPLAQGPTCRPAAPSAQGQRCSRTAPTGSPGTLTQCVLQGDALSTPLSVDSSGRTQGKLSPEFLRVGNGVSAALYSDVRLTGGKMLDPRGFP